MLSYGKTTGATGLMIGSLAINQVYLLVIALVFVISTAIVLRLGWRRGKAASDR